MNPTKYKAYPVIENFERTWPNNTITKAPTWVSSDLRDGNQALSTPLSLEEKVEYFKRLVAFGFKEIEVGFPSATNTDHTFIRTLIENNLVPDDVTLQILIPPKNEHIERSFESMKGCRHFIAHLFITTSINQRIGSQEELLNQAEKSTLHIKQACEAFEGDVTFEFTPEGFSHTELDFAKAICNKVIDTWEPTAEKQMIVNIPNTMEKTTPNVYADRVEWMSRHLNRREALIISLHPHNDRGTGVACSELAMLAGATRIEGTVLGNGERAGNVDLITLAFNLYAQGIDPKLDLKNIDAFIGFVANLQKLPIHPRHPYIGEMVYSAFSAYHQEAIHKGLQAYEESAKTHWDVPYLAIDPKDIGRDYEGVKRIGIDSDKEDVIHVIEQSLHVSLPKHIQKHFGTLIQNHCKSGDEIDREALIDTFKTTYMRMDKPFALLSYDVRSLGGGSSTCTLIVRYKSLSYSLRGEARGPLEAACMAIKEGMGLDVNIVDYHEHTANKGASAKAVSFIQVSLNGVIADGIGEDEDITVSSLKGLVAAINNAEV